jgi:hypothetical protein
MKNANMTARADKGQVARPFQVGDIVSNFGAMVRVEQIDPERGLLVRIIPWQRWIEGRGWVQQGGVGQRYFANPAMCAPRTAATVGWPSTANLNGDGLTAGQRLQQKRRQARSDAMVRRHAQAGNTSVRGGNS